MTETTMSSLIESYISSRRKKALEKLDKDSNSKRAKMSEDSELLKFDSEVSGKRLELEEKFSPVNWLTDASKRAKQISVVSHALKFTHTDAKGSSVLTSVTPSSNCCPNKVSSASVEKLELDVVGNAAALDVAGLLKLECEGMTLIQLLQENDFSALQPFAQSADQLTEWIDGLKRALSPAELSSHKLAKQLFFPTANDEYHLLSPLFATSLVNHVYGRVNSSWIGDNAKEARAAKREGRMSELPAIQFPNIIVQSFGGTKPQNVSSLNSARRGNVYLFRSAPPVWKTQGRLPTDRQNSFWLQYENANDREASKTAYHLKLFLQKNLNKPSTIEIRSYREKLVDQLIDMLIQHAAYIQQWKSKAGWSEASKLPMSEQYWLDPHRVHKDEDFKQGRESSDWREDIANTFARWLNNKLGTKKMRFGDVEFNEWASLIKSKLTLLKEDLTPIEELA